MLMNRIRDTYRDIIAQFTAVESVVTVTTKGPAANASEFVSSDMQARRHRRQRRMERAGTHGVSGWTVRTW